MNQTCSICGHDLAPVPLAVHDPDTGSLEAECSIHGDEHGTQWIEVG